MTPEKDETPEEPDVPESETPPSDGETDECQALEDAVNQMQQMAIEGFQAIQYHLKDIQQALLNLEARMGDLTARVHGIETEIGTPESIFSGEQDTQEKLDVAGQQLGENIKKILNHRENDKDAI